MPNVDERMVAAEMAASAAAAYQHDQRTQSAPRAVPAVVAAAAVVAGRGLHSSTFRLNVSTFCGIRRVHDVPPVC